MVDNELVFISSLLRSPVTEKDAFYSKQYSTKVFPLHEVKIQWLYDFRQKNGVFPSVKLFESKWQTALPKLKDDPKETLQVVLDVYQVEQMKRIADASSKMIAAGKNTEAVEFWKRESEKLTLINTSDDIHFDKTSSSLFRYRDLVRVKTLEANTLVDTPWASLNKMVKFFRPGEVIVLAARTSIGKAQPLTARILTPSGFVPMGSLKVGSVLKAKDGSNQKVVAIHPQGRKKVYRVKFNDGTSTECCDDHLWSVASHDSKKKGDYSFQAVPLKEIRARLSCRGRLLWEVPEYQGHDLPSQSLPLHPYLVGALLGDGTLAGNVCFTKNDKEVVVKVASLLPPNDELVPDSANNKRTWRVRHRAEKGRPTPVTLEHVRKLNMQGKRSYNKEIPHQYMIGSREQRVELLQGLMDTDGYVIDTGKSFEFTTVSSVLANQFMELVRSLGASYVHMRSRTPSYSYKGKKCKGRLAYTIGFRFYNDVVPVSCERHLIKLKPSMRRYRKMIESVSYVGVKEAQCITVSSPDHCYVTDEYIVTHNSWWTMCLSHYWASKGVHTLFVSKEMSTESVNDRIEAIHFKLPYPNVRGGDLSAKQLRTWAKSRQAALSFPLIITGDESIRGSGMGSIVSKTQQYQPQVVVIDGAYLINPDGVSKNASATERLGSVSSAAKRIAKATKTIVILVVQMNRKAEKKNGDTKGSIGDIYGSDAWAQDADFVLDLSGKRGSTQRMVSLIKGRESALGEFYIRFQLDPHPDFSEISGAGQSSVLNTPQGAPEEGREEATPLGAHNFKGLV